MEMTFVDAWGAERNAPVIPPHTLSRDCSEANCILIDTSAAAARGPHGIAQAVDALAGAPDDRNGYFGGRWASSPSPPHCLVALSGHIPTVETAGWTSMHSKIGWPEPERFETIGRATGMALGDKRAGGAAGSGHRGEIHLESVSSNDTFEGNSAPSQEVASLLLRSAKSELVSPLAQLAYGGSPPTEIDSWPEGSSAASVTYSAWAASEKGDRGPPHANCAPQPQHPHGGVSHAGAARSMQLERVRHAQRAPIRVIPTPLREAIENHSQHPVPPLPSGGEVLNRFYHGYDRMPLEPASREWVSLGSSAASEAPLSARVVVPDSPFAPLSYTTVPARLEGREVLADMTNTGKSLTKAVSESDSDTVRRSTTIDDKYSVGGADSTWSRSVSHLSTTRTPAKQRGSSRTSKSRRTSQSVLVPSLVSSVEIAALENEVQNVKDQLRESQSELRQHQKMFQDCLQDERAKIASGSEEERHKQRSEFQRSLDVLRQENAELRARVEELEGASSREAQQEKLREADAAWKAKLSETVRQWREKLSAVEAQHQVEVREQTAAREEAEAQCRALATTVSDIEEAFRRSLEENKILERRVAANSLLRARDIDSLIVTPRDGSLSARSAGAPKTLGHGSSSSAAVLALEREVQQLRDALQEATSRHGALLSQVEMGGRELAASELVMESSVRALKVELEKERRRSAELVKLYSCQIESLHCQIDEASKRNESLRDEIKRLERIQSDLLI